MGPQGAPKEEQLIIESWDMMNLPILGISMGDPFGNGPEITNKALAD